MSVKGKITSGIMFLYNKWINYPILYMISIFVISFFGIMLVGKIDPMIIFLFFLVITLIFFSISFLTPLLFLSKKDCFHPVSEDKLKAGVLQKNIKIILVVWIVIALFSWIGIINAGAIKHSIDTIYLTILTIPAALVSLYLYLITGVYSCREKSKVYVNYLKHFFFGLTVIFILISISLLFSDYIN